MTIRLALIAALLSLVVAAPASANYRVGLGEQNPQMFSTPSWQSLKLKRVRYLVPWDYAKHGFQRDEVNHFMQLARSNRQDVLGLETLNVRHPSPEGLVAAAAAEVLAKARPAALTPLYLRRPDAVEPTGRKRVTKA